MAFNDVAVRTFLQRKLCETMVCIGKRNIFSIVCRWLCGSKLGAYSGTRPMNICNEFTFMFLFYRLCKLLQLPHMHMRNKQNAVLPFLKGCTYDDYPYIQHIA